MSYQPHGEYDGRPRYAQQHYPEPDEYRARGRRDERTADTIANLIRVIVGLVTLVFALHVLFVVLDANHHNGFVHAIYVLAKALVLGLGDVFTPDDALIGVIMNYGLAALVYAVVGHLIIRALRR
ncbi:hypothetical protein [Amycolatopsis thermophila]|uniref:Integral membrane protein n=1 Tax=Amycolatopsis thermophila TaxID=206084 RepID=A0ABU0F0Z2_9PSEU|nr:hypothetical protein [Amycolatopsis thermophila]MDQ0381241.1 hypothetical protein [Amycolatopsis thermophila]